MATMTVKRCIAVLFACAVGLTLSACGSSSNFVADSWPHFAGGEPNDVPPRPGSPGYRTFISHGQPPDGADAQAPGAPSQPGGVTPEFVARQPGVSGQQVPAGTTATPPPQNPPSAPPAPGAPNQNVGQGGLY